MPNNIRTKIEFYCPHWGSEHLSYEAFLHQVKQSGFDGVEMMLPFDDAKCREIDDLLTSLDLKLIGHVGGPIAANSIEATLASYEKLVLKSCELSPVLVNLQSGRDYYSIEENERFITLANAIGAAHNLKIVHETHRGKFSFAAHVMTNYLHRNPNLRITADFSHWCCVAESLLEDQHQALDLAISRTDHIHARVGFSQGPQVTDPRANKSQDAFNAHLAWWDKIVQLKQQTNSPLLTITPEFGPEPYMPITSTDELAVANQWETNTFMKDFLKARYC